MSTGAVPGPLHRRGHGRCRTSTCSVRRQLTDVVGINVLQLQAAVCMKEGQLHRHHSEALTLASSMPGRWGLNGQLAVCPCQPARPTPAVKKTQLANLQLRHLTSTTTTTTTTTRIPPRQPTPRLRPRPTPANAHLVGLRHGKHHPAGAHRRACGRPAGQENRLPKKGGRPAPGDLQCEGCPA